MLDYIISVLSGHDMNGLDYGAIGAFMLYKCLQNSIRRILRKVETIIIIYIAMYIGYKIWEYLL